MTYVIYENILNASNIRKVKWYKQNLYIFFYNGTVYKYMNVPWPLYDKLCAASSPGLFMHRYLKNEYSYMKIRNPEKKGEAINIIFDGELGVEGPRFIEVENDRGESLKVGEWIKRLDGYLTLRIDQLPKELKK